MSYAFYTCWAANECAHKRIQKRIQNDAFFYSFFYSLVWKHTLNICLHRCVLFTPHLNSILFHVLDQVRTYFAVFFCVSLQRFLHLHAQFFLLLSFGRAFFFHFPISRCILKQYFHLKSVSAATMTENSKACSHYKRSYICSTNAKSVQYTSSFNLHFLRSHSRLNFCSLFRV